MHKRETILALVVVILVYLAGCAYVFSHTADDAYISLRYAENLVHHGQLSFNPGDSPAEGYSNFFLVLIEAFSAALGFPYPVLVPKLVGLLSGIAVIILSWAMASIIGVANGWLRLLSCLAVATSTPFIVWAVGGLETVLFTALVMAGMGFYLASLDQPGRGFCLLSDLCFLLSALTRPEGILFWGLTYLFTLARWKTTVRKERVGSGVLFFTMFLLYLAWKLWYFGDVLPLTYYAKEANPSLAGFLEGFRRLWNLLKIDLNLLYPAFFCLATVRALARREIKLVYLVLPNLAYAVYVLSMGDKVSMNYVFRFWVPLLPAAYLVAARGMEVALATIPPSLRRYAHFLVVIAMAGHLALGTASLHRAWNKDVEFGGPGVFSGIGLGYLQEQMNECYLAMGVWLSQNAPRDAKVVIVDVGLVPYYSKLRTIDVYSLVNKEIVLLKRERRKRRGSPEWWTLTKRLVDVVFRENPEYIISVGGLPFWEDPRAQQYDVIAKMFFFRGKERPVWMRNDLGVNRTPH